MRVVYQIGYAVWLRSSGVSLGDELEGRERLADGCEEGLEVLFGIRHREKKRWKKKLTGCSIP